MAFYVNGDTSPSNLHVLDLTTGEHRRMTETLAADIDDVDLAGPGNRVYQM